MEEKTNSRSTHPLEWLPQSTSGEDKVTKKPYRSSKVLNSHHKRWRRLLRSRSDMYISIALIEQSNSMGESFNNRL